MAWTAVKDWAPEELVTAAMMDTYVSANTQFLYDVIGGVQDYGADWLISTGRKLSWSDPDVAHGITSLAATDVWGAIQPTSGTAGGATLFGFTDADAEALRLYGIIGSAAALASTAVVAFGAKKNGAGIQALAAGESVFDISNNGTVYFRLLGDGTISLGLNSNPKLLMDTGDYHLYSKASNFFQWVIGSVQEMLLEASGLTVTNRVTADDAVFSSGACIGFAGTPVADEAQVGDANFALVFVSSTQTRIRLDADATIDYNRTNNLMQSDMGGGYGIQQNLNDVYLGGTGATNGGAIATTAANGFAWISHSAGAPTGTPTPRTGAPSTFKAVQYDSTNNRLYVYNGAWRFTTLTT